MDSMYNSTGVLRPSAPAHYAQHLPTCVHLTVASVVSPVVIHSSEGGQKLVAWGEGEGLYFDLV